MSTPYGSWEGVDVRVFWSSDHTAHGEAVVVKWEPLSSGMCDALVRFSDGYECWYATSSLKPVDGRPRQSRADARREADERTLATLRTVRANHIGDFNQPWPGCEFGKAIVGNALTRAIQDVEGRLSRSRT